MTTASVLVLNGPNLNLLGEREPEVYGAQALADVEERLGVLAGELGLAVRFAQSNSEGELVSLIQQARGGGGIVVNAGAYSHYSYAIRDALAAVPVPCVEVHISNIYAREEFRAHSVLAPVVDGFVCGCGTFGYELALRQVAHLLAQRGSG
ncbi:MAG: type II 3-dehydroquinate dehydratase [Mycobacteriales bacterium]